MPSRKDINNNDMNQIMRGARNTNPFVSTPQTKQHGGARDDSSSPPNAKKRHTLTPGNATTATNLEAFLQDQLIELRNLYPALNDRLRQTVVFTHGDNNDETLGYDDDDIPLVIKTLDEEQLLSQTEKDTITAKI